jgi:hypothetical protein
MPNIICKAGIFAAIAAFVMPIPPISYMQGAIAKNILNGFCCNTVQ